MHLFKADLRNCFFDAIKVHRRDFEQIKKFMNSRLGKNGTQKNKDQIRHMYYRTLGTIQKSLTDSQLVYPTVLRDKLDQEFYAMTAYAELRKKMQKDPPRKLLESKLEELLKTQQTVVKTKGLFLTPNDLKNPCSLFENNFKGSQQKSKYRRLPSDPWNHRRA